jgi:excisionase family DNA binding protein
VGSRKYFTTAEVAEILGVTEGTVREWIRTGDLVAIDIAKGARHDYRISGEELDKFARSRQIAV